MQNRGIGEVNFRGIDVPSKNYDEQAPGLATPKAVYDELVQEFGFDFDPCLVATDTLHPIDMLGSSWRGKSIYVNPPYKHLEQWIRKCYEEHRKGKTVVMLIPSRTDTKAFHEYIYGKAELRFIKGRLCFDDSGKPAPFPSMVVIWRN